METRLTFKYDRTADILYIDKTPPYPEQETEELGDDVIARLNPTSGEIENLEVLFFSTRLLRSDLFELPVTETSMPVAELLDGLYVFKAVFNFESMHHSWVRE